MDLKTEILREHSKPQALYVSGWIGKNPDRFAVLMDLFHSSEYRIAQRAAWVCTHCIDQHPDLIRPYLSNLVDLIESPVHVAVRRNAVRILTKVELPEALWGLAADKCMRRVADPNETVAVRRFAMEVVWNICQKEPDLSTELRLILEDNMEYGSPGFRNYGQKLLNRILKS
ncbi:MAG: hypothetical protein KDC34_15205 [Saprospiraceae bacterium]|nr:hypothetical protein [Saprospiraceae bacterium]